MSRATPDDLALVPQPLFGPAQLEAQLRQIATTAVLELDPLEIVPDALVRVEIGRIAGQALQMHPLRRACRQVVFDRLPLMDGRALPDNEHLAADLAEHHPQKADDRFGGIRVLLHLQEQTPVQGDPTDDREVVAVSLTRNTGVFPRGAQVRTARGSR